MAFSVELHICAERGRSWNTNTQHARREFRRKKQGLSMEMAPFSLFLEFLEKIELNAFLATHHEIKMYIK